MSLKTATLITIIGIIVHFCVVVLYMFGISLMFRISPVLHKIVSIFNTMIFHSIVILFLAVFYFNQNK